MPIIKIKTYLPILIFILFFFSFCGPSPKDLQLQRTAMRLFGSLPPNMPGSESDTKAMASLGEKLFSDKILSVNDSQSCATCHALDKKMAGVDNLPTSPGALKKFGPRNTPTVLNAGYQFAQFWDGRARDLVEQAKGPILNPIEMAMPDEKTLEKKLRSSRDYPGLFKKAFPNEKEPLSFHNIARAIAAFERTLISKSRFDDFIEGSSKALSEDEKKGLRAFINRRCTACHSKSMIGGDRYRKLGDKNPYEDKSDLGRYEASKEESDKFKFKVPSLRNAAKTAPYFHNGKTASLEETVKKIAWYQLDVKLPDSEAQLIVKFLQALSDKKRF